MDLSALSTEDLQALRAGDLSRVSTSGLQAMRGATERASVDPTKDMSGLSTLRAGIGRGMASAARGVGNLFGMVSDEDMAESKRLDANLLNTMGGKVGNVLGLGAAAAPLALVPGANTYLGAAGLGSLFGGLTTEGGAGDRLEGAAFGAAGGAAGKGLGEMLGAGGRAVKDWATSRAATQAAGDAQKFAAANAGAQAGYKVPPADLQPGALTELLSGLSGKIKTAQTASQQNQQVTNRLARREIGVPDDVPLTADALKGVRTSAATEGYAPIRSAGEVVADASYTKALDKIASQYQGAARSFPGAAKNPVVEMVEGLRQQKFDAGDALDMVKVLREQADDAYRAGNTGLGKATKTAAGALEDQIERHLKDAGSPEAMAAFREARKLIAKTYSVQKGLNQQTGDVSAQALARDLARGKPLSGDLLTIAQMGQAFPKATQSLKETPKATSPLDWLVAAGMTGTQGPMGALTLGARPAARSLLLSAPYQRSALKQSTGPGLLGHADLLNDDFTRRLMQGLLGANAANANE